MMVDQTRAIGTCIATRDVHRCTEELSKTLCLEFCGTFAPANASDRRVPRASERMEKAPFRGNPAQNCGIVELWNGIVAGDNTPV